VKIKQIYNWLVDNVCEYVTNSEIVHKEIKISLRTAKVVLKFVRGNIKIGCAVANNGSELYSVQCYDSKVLHFESLNDLINHLRSLQS
jgi:hypothetical protein